MKINLIVRWEIIYLPKDLILFLIVILEVINFYYNHTTFCFVFLIFIMLFL